VTHDAPDDATLVGLALNGDDAAFRQIMSRHRQAIFRLARRYLGDPEAALDIVQDSFVAAWQALARYDRDRPLSAWLRAIALNKCRDAARRAFLRRVILGQADVSGPEALAHADPAEDPEASLMGRERLSRLDRAVAQLPEGLKEPLILTVFEGLSQPEAAAVLGLSAKAIEVRVYRARRRLAALLGAPGD
jgi:RNA polymerase sigma-70 factor (ECF subfamily)